MARAWPRNKAQGRQQDGRTCVRHEICAAACQPFGSPEAWQRLCPMLPNLLGWQATTEPHSPVALQVCPQYAPPQTPGDDPNSVLTPLNISSGDVTLNSNPCKPWKLPHLDLDPAFGLLVHEAHDRGHHHLKAAHLLVAKSQVNLCPTGPLSMHSVRLT